uniref:UDP-glucuronosyltransferase n=1 Tax=Anoplophora glabripennis TaxID=217634 RepID=V5GU86_ANOGL
MSASLRYLVGLCLLLAPSFTGGARILGMFPTSSPSHYILGGALMKGLAEAGHDVTVISPFVHKHPPKKGKWREIILEGFMEEFNKKFESINMFEMDFNPLLFSIMANQMGNKIVEETLNYTKVQDLIKSNEKFDAYIVPQFMNDGLKALAHHFGGHLILFSQTAPNSWFNHLVGNPSMPSFLPEVVLNIPSKMSFFQRLQNTLVKFFSMSNTYLIFYPKQNKLVQKYLPNPVDLNDAMYNISLVLLNSHVSLFAPQPAVPCMVEIGGFHVEPPKKLPKDLQSFLDNATEGVIYFSMGSNLKSKNLPVEKREAILKAFGKRKEKVLWKWEDDVLPGQPSNIKLGKWLPQQDILAHPNVKLFITHGGLLSTTETVYHGVPIIAIPIFGDQKMNAYNAKEAGYGLILPFTEMTEETLSSALAEILENPKYRENAKERSRIMHDRQVKPLDNAVYWVEYVIRHNGARHLRVPYLELTWYQFYLLDVFLFIFAVIFTVLFVIKKAVSYLCRRSQSKTKKE